MIIHIDKGEMQMEKVVKELCDNKNAVIIMPMRRSTAAAAIDVGKKKTRCGMGFS